MIAYFNCISGISGDMILGSLVDAGVSLEALKKELSKLPVRGYELKARKVKRGGLRATKVDVLIINPSKSPLIKGGQKAEAKKWKDIERIIKTSTLSKEIKQKGLYIFKRLFEAEAKVHGEKMQDVHLHELGAVDCIVDIFGALIGLDILGVDTICSSPLNLGSGTIKTEHGMLPVPAPATLRLLKGVPVYSSGVQFELTTPTGAVLISSLVDKFAHMPDMQISKTGVGAGSKDFHGQPNVLTMILGEKTEHRTQNTDNGVAIIETNIDDMNPQVYEYVMGRLFEAGALDVFLTQIIMKKGRPGIILSVLCDENKKEKLIEIILHETTSIGVRFYRAERKMLQREIKSVSTKFGNLNVKVAYSGKEIKKDFPEYEDCRKAARKYKVPLLEVMKRAASSGKGQG